MKSKIRRFFAVTLPLAAMLLPTVVYGQSNPTEQGLSGIRGAFGSMGRLGQARSVGDLIAEIIRIMLFFAGMIAVLFIIIGGYQYITSNGNDESAEKGRKTLTNAVIGLVIIGLSWVIVNVVINTVSGSGGLFGIF